MADNKHIEEAAHSVATTRTDIDEWQFGILTDNSDTNAPSGQQEATCHANASATSLYVHAMSKVIDPSTGTERYLEVEFKDIYASNNMYVAGSIYELGDTDTRIRFDVADKINIECGGISMVDFIEDTQDYIEFNPTEVDVDFTVNTTVANTIFCEGSSGNVGISNATPGTVNSTSPSGTIFNVKPSSGIANIAIEGDYPVFHLVDSAGGADDKWGRLYADNGKMVFDSLTDAAAARKTILQMDLGSGAVAMGTTPDTASRQFQIIAADGEADNDWTMIVQNNEGTDGRSFGALVRGGSTSADQCVLFQDHDGTNTLLEVQGGGNVLIPNGTLRLGASPATDTTLLMVDAADGEYANSYVAKFWNQEETDGDSFGVYIAAGSTTGDFALSIRDHDEVNLLFTIMGDGTLQFGKSKVAGNATIAGTIAAKDKDGNDIYLTYSDSAAS